jgi:hypothetical protein
MLEYVDAHRTVYIVRQLLWLAPSLFLMVVFLALAVALRHQGKSFAAIGGLIAIASWAVSFAWPTTGDGSLAMVVLSDRYADAGTLAERAPFVAGAEVLIALNDVPAVIGVLQTLGILLISLLMLRGTFPQGVAWLGTATGAIGVISEVLRPVLGLGVRALRPASVRLAGLDCGRALATRVREAVPGCCDNHLRSQPASSRAR